MPNVVTHNISDAFMRPPASFFLIESFDIEDSGEGFWESHKRFNSSSAESDTKRWTDILRSNEGNFERSLMHLIDSEFGPGYSSLIVSGLDLPGEAYMWTEIRHQRVRVGSSIHNATYAATDISVLHNGKVFVYESSRRLKDHSDLKASIFDAKTWHKNLTEECLVAG